MSDRTPRHFQRMRQQYADVMDALQQLGAATAQAGPLDGAQAHLVQLAAAAAQRSEGAVHSHVRRALKAGCTPEQISHALILLVPTIGYPTVAAALSWAFDIIDEA
ncbi:carboxymuconolactone decarboxylase family protein [Oleidesulfovibrio alaskensis]|uniref:carboxymuconolactone decarboxylase family protein n=1 Tax=Oleidesulfovibrio alaskensis TaxID=58180 RepID=UPI001A3B7564|nr:carboxymuconolactone decarboxylase family protein [Oleidesulfovibrio alaskensis]MBL3581561.1 carboxymuconolactone decarboxylase family protein [Oleidesulfovibrio alaskensis]